MPTKAFFNLDSIKQKTIIDAAISEFSNHLLEEASINHIIKSINMPRGSFYLYFENKEDLYLYILEFYNLKLIELFKKFSIQNNGDLINTFIDVFDYIISKSQTSEFKSLIKNIFINMNSKQLNLVFDKKVKEDEIKQLLKNINVDRLNAITSDETNSIIRIMFTLMAHAIGIYFTYELPYEKVRATFTQDLNILKKGIYK